jgi:hypothetical protein
VECLEDRVTPIFGIATSTTLLAAPDPAPTGHMITLTAFVADSQGFSPVGGTVDFFDGATPLGTVPLVPAGSGPGSAQLTVPAPTAGSYLLTARYSGFVLLMTDDFASTSAPLLEVVGAGADVSAFVHVRRGPLLPGPQPGQFQQRLTLRNVGGLVLPGTLELVLDGLGRTVRLRHQAGVTTVLPPLGSPFVRVVVPGGVWDPGQRVTVLLRFTVPAGGHVHYTPRVLAGAG